MNRVLRTTLPTTRTQRDPLVPDQKKVKTRDQKLKQKQNFDKHHGARPLSTVKQGTTVWIPARQMEGTVTQEVAPFPTCINRRWTRSSKEPNISHIELPQTLGEEQDAKTGAD